MKPAQTKPCAATQAGRFLSPILLALAAVVSSDAQERSWEWNLDVGIEARVFAESPALPEQDSQSVQPSVTLQPEWLWKSETGDDQVFIKPFVRLDAIDDERTHWDIREATWSRAQDDWEVEVGINKVYWGVVESRHLVDIINQTDGVENIDEEDKLGQPMIRGARFADWGTVEFLLMTGFRERSFPGRDGRLRPPLLIDVDNPVYESSQEEWRPEVALRYSHYFGPMDVGVHAFSGTSREPRLVPAVPTTALTDPGEGSAAPSDPTRLVPHYDLMNQAGLDIQYTGEATLWKGEAFVREATDDPFLAASVGVEHTFYQLAGSAVDLGLLAELHLDDHSENDPATFFDEDVFIGTRLSLNDAQDTAVLAGALRDIDSDETFWTVEAERRFGDDWVAELELRAFSGLDVESPLGFLSEDSFATLRLTRYF